MNELERLSELGARMEQAAPDPIDVTARVLRTIRLGRQRKNRWSLSIQPLAAVLAASWVSVLITGIFVQQAWSQLQDPITSLLTPFVVALQ